MDNARPSWLLSDVRWGLAIGGCRAGVWHRVCCAALVLLAARVCLAEGDAEALYRAAEIADAAFDFRAALARYEAASKAAPLAAFARAASLRARDLREHAEGDFVPLVRLERVRRDPELSSNPSALDALVRDAEAFPEGTVRVEARMLAADAYANRLARPGDAAVLWRQVVVDPRAGGARALAARSLAFHHLARGELAAASDVARLAGANADPALARDIERFMRRRFIATAALAVIALTAVVASFVVAMFARRHGLRVLAARVRPTVALIALFVGFVAIAGGLLASRYERGTSGPFVLFGLALAALLFLARAWSAAGSRSRVARTGRAVACAASVLGAAFLVLERADGDYLSGLGL